MPEAEPPPNSPSTSRSSPLTCDTDPDATCTCSTSSSSLIDPLSPVFLSLDFDKLSLDTDLREGRYDQHVTPQNQDTEDMPPVAKKKILYRIPVHKNGRFLPYSVPYKLRRRRKLPKPVVTTHADLEVFLKIKLKGEVDPLRMCVFDKENVLPKPCSVQAVRPPSATEEIDELSEYFTHFVRVELKMSALAESMYV